MTRRGLLGAVRCPGTRRRAGGLSRGAAKAAPRSSTSRARRLSHRRGARRRRGAAARPAPRSTRRAAPAGRQGAGALRGGPPRATPAGRRRRGGGGARVVGVDDLQLAMALLGLQQVLVGYAPVRAHQRRSVHADQVHERAVLPQVAGQLHVEAVLLHLRLLVLARDVHDAARARRRPRHAGGLCGLRCSLLLRVRGLGWRQAHQHSQRPPGQRLTVRSSNVWRSICNVNVKMVTCNVKGIGKPRVTHTHSSLIPL